MTVARVVHWIRTLHVYLSLATFGAVLLFSMTGLLLGLGQWWDWETPITTQRALAVPANVELAAEGPQVLTLGRAIGFRGALVSSDSSTPGQIILVFQRPGWRGEATIRSDTRMAQITEESRGVLGYLADLHRDHATNSAWRIVLLTTATVLSFLVISGVVLWWKVLSRRKWGIFWLIAGAAIAAGAGLWPLV